MNENIPDRTFPETVNKTDFESVLVLAQNIADNHLRPYANELDIASVPPYASVQMIAQSGLLGLTTPMKYGGLEAPGAVVRRYTEIMSGACGTTTFVQGQHLSACTLIATGENETLKEQTLPSFAEGSRICGIAFAHVRKPGAPVLRATDQTDFYEFNGVASWFTGWGIMTDVLIAATLPNGNFVYGVIPIPGAPELEATEPMKLCAMNASGTVVLNCNKLIIPKSRVLKVITPEQMSITDSGAVFGVTPQILGLCTECVRSITRLSENRNSPSLAEHAQKLREEITTMRREIDLLRSEALNEESKSKSLELRAECIVMGVRFAHAVVAATGGSANDRSNSAQRLFREAMFYTLTAQTKDIQAATLNLLA